MSREQPCRKAGLFEDMEKGMEEKKQLQNISEEQQKRENLRIRKTQWIQEQIQRQREAEDTLFAQIQQEQEVLDALKMSINQNMECTKEAKKYNQEFQQHMDAQVFAMYGITEDKLQGMREYRNAYYQGCAFSLFFLSIVLVALCGILHGFQSEICLFMLAFSGIQGALLAQEKKRKRWFHLLCKTLYLLMFPLMMVIFVCYELNYPEYGLLLPIFTIFGIGVLVIGTAAYFLYNPYRGDKRVVEEARDTIREIEKTARKEIKRNRKIREKAEKKENKKRRKSEVRAKRKASFFAHFKNKKTKKGEAGIKPGITGIEQGEIMGEALAAESGITGTEQGETLEEVTETGSIVTGTDRWETLEEIIETESEYIGTKQPGKRKEVEIDSETTGTNQQEMVQAEFENKSEEIETEPDH